MLRFICAASLALAPSLGHGQDAARLAGEWRLVSFTTPDSAGRQQPAWGPNPIGLIVYTRGVTMAAQLYDPRRDKLGVPPARASAEQLKQAFVGGISYYGSYTLDTVAHTVTHHIEGANNPDWIGGHLVRAYAFTGKDRVTLKVLTNFDGTKVANGSELVWERVKR